MLDMNFATNAQPCYDWGKSSDFKILDYCKMHL